MEHSYLELEAGSTVLSAVLPTEEANVLHVRFYEAAGREDKAVFRFAKAPVSAVSVNLNGSELISDVQIRGSEVTVTAKAFSLGQLRITF